MAHEDATGRGRAWKLVISQKPVRKLVTVVGYKHERDVEVKKGNQSFKKRLVEIYGSTVQTPKGSSTKVSQ